MRNRMRGESGAVSVKANPGSMFSTGRARVGGGVGLTIRLGFTENNESCVT